MKRPAFSQAALLEIVSGVADLDPVTFSGGLGSDGQYALGINDGSSIKLVGWATDTNFLALPWYAPVSTLQAAMLDVPIVIPNHPKPQDSGFALDISDGSSAMVAGYVLESGTAPTSCSGHIDASRWTFPGASFDELDELVTASEARAVRISDDDKWVGFARNDALSGCFRHAVVWTTSTTPVDLHQQGSPSPFASSDETFAFGINNNSSKQIVGTSANEFAVLWQQNGSNYDPILLNDTIPVAMTVTTTIPLWSLREAHDVNDDGWIVGWGARTIKENGIEQEFTHAFVLIPRDPSYCAGDITDNMGGGPDGFVNVFDLLALLAAWGDCDTGMGDPMPETVEDCMEFYSNAAEQAACIEMVLKLEEE